MKLFKRNILSLITVIFILSSCSNYAQKNDINNSSILSIDTVLIDTSWSIKVDKSDAYWKANLSENQYQILRNKGTERPFTSKLLDNKKDGVYVCAACKNPLYGSNTKFNSGTGWPSFFKAFSTKSIEVHNDESHGMIRKELVCARCNGHLGHVFNDGPQPTGERHCINGGSLNFIPTNQKEDNHNNLKTAVFAQGCFWCVEEIYESLNGVTKVVSGYSGGEKKNPTYKEVSKGTTNHAEAVQVTYNPEVITYEQLLKVYFNSGDITQVNGQGNDRGKQYRSIIFYHNKTENQLINTYLETLNQNEKYAGKIAVEVAPMDVFYPAEAYHQDFVKLNPNQGYVKSVSIPRYKRAIQHFPELLKAAN